MKCLVKKSFYVIVHYFTVGIYNYFNNFNGSAGYSRIKLLVGVHCLWSMFLFHIVCSSLFILSCYIVDRDDNREDEEQYI